MRARSVDRSRRPLEAETPQAMPAATAEHPLLGLQRMCGNRSVQRALASSRQLAGGDPLYSNLVDTIRDSRGTGRELERSVRDDMEDILDADLGAVRIHTDGRADVLARALNAEAFTTANDVFFHRALYDPTSPRGRGLLAHELTHVLQQTGGRPQHAPTESLVLGEPGDVHERAAESAAGSAARGVAAADVAATAAAGGTVQRQEISQEDIRAAGVANQAGARREDIAAKKRSRKVRAKWKYEEQREKAGAGYKQEESRLEKGAEKLIEKGAKKVKEKAEKVATEVPAEKLTEAEESPEALFLKDMTSGMEKVREYLDYIEKATDYWEKYKGPRPAGLDAAVNDIGRITSGISAGLGTAIKVTRRGKEIADFVSAAREVARATDAWKDPQDAVARKNWEKSVKTAARAAAPLLEWAKKYLYDAALAGEAWAGAAFFTLSYVIAEVQIAWKAYEVGAEAIEIGMEREKRALKIAGGWEPPPERGPPPPPEPPLKWYTTAELKQAETQEAARRKALAARVEENKRIQALRERFEVVFVDVYRKHRPRIKKTLEAKYVAALKGRKAGYEDVPEEAWWDALISDGTEYEIEGAVTVERKRENVTHEAAETEISNFQGIGCPDFDQLYFSELSRWMETQLRKPAAPHSR